MGYVAKIKITHGSQEIQPGEPMPDDLTEAQVNDLLQLGAIEQAPVRSKAKKVEE